MSWENKTLRSHLADGVWKEKQRDGGRGRLRIKMKEQGKWGIQRTRMGIRHASLASFFKANVSEDILKKEKEYRPQSLFLILK